MKYYIQAFKKYAVFNGRASRKEFWLFQLFNIIITFVLGIAMPYVVGVYVIFSVVPDLAVTVRRLHDVGYSGFFIFMLLIPFIGQAWCLFALCSKGHEWTNDYGDPSDMSEPLNEEKA